jgi:hypothetical protein
VIGIGRVRQFRLSLPTSEPNPSTVQALEETRHTTTVHTKTSNSPIALPGYLTRAVLRGTNEECHATRLE